MATYESKKYGTIPVAATQIADGSVTNAEYQFINSLSSNAQTQITALDAAKLNLAGGTITGNVTITDNDHLYIGNGQDIDVFSDGSTGFIKGNDLRLQSSTGESYITAVVNGATKIFHDNSQKLETTGSGVTVAGAMAATTVTGDGSALTNLNASNISSGTINSSRLPGGLGKVLQVVSANTTTHVSSSSTSYTDISGLNVSITPSATNSKVLVVCNIGVVDDASGSNGSYGFRLIRGSTAIGNGSGGGQTNAIAGLGQATNNYSQVMVHFLDSPSTTSSTNYKFQFRGLYNPQIRINRSQDNGAPFGIASSASITAIEIGA